MSTYQELSHQLEVTMNKLQSGELSLDETIDAYNEGIAIIKKMEKQLLLAENKIKKIKDSLQ